MSEEEKKAIEKVKEVIKIDKERRIVTIYDEKPLFRDQLQIIIDLINKQQKEINFYKKEELGYIAGYEDGKRHKQTAVMIKKENAQQELFEKEIEKLNFENHMIKKWNEQLDKDCISKNKIREKIKEYQEKYNNYPNYTPEDFEFRQEYLHKFGALEELLEENNGDHIPRID